MKETPEFVDQQVLKNEIGKIRFLSGITNRPELFLHAQNKLLYEGGGHTILSRK